MLKLNPDEHTLNILEDTDLHTENILERYGFQNAIVNSWELFRKEIGIPSALLVGSEIRPHDSTQDSLDILAFDPDDSQVVVIELKRKKNKLQLLQALSYAAMVSRWDVEKLAGYAKNTKGPDSQELVDSIQSVEENLSVKVILVAEAYDPEVILTADWLKSNYSVDISAYSIELNKSQGDLILSVTQRYPLRGLEDTYKPRSRKQANDDSSSEVTWEDMLPKLKYSFAKQLITLCKSIRAGEPKRRRFSRIRKNFEGFSWISIHLKYKYVNVWIKGERDEARTHLQSKFSETVEINSWRDGWSVIVDTESKFNDLVKWLEL